MRNTKYWKAAFALAMFSMIASGAVAQNLYKWTDSSGKVYYSDQPPPPDARDAKALKRDASPRGGGEEDEGSAAPDSSYAEKEKEFQRRRAEKAEQETKANQAAQADAERKRNCEAAKSNLQSVSAGGRITRRNSAGELEYLGDDDIAAERERAQEVVNQWCNG